MVQRRIGSGDTVGIMVRVPEGLRDRVRAGAEASGRSMNAEIVAVLEREYPAPRTPHEIYELLDLLLDYLPDKEAAKDIHGKTHSLNDLRECVQDLIESESLRRFPVPARGLLRSLARSNDDPDS